jgi:hypothetical protein
MINSLDLAAISPHGHPQDAPLALRRMASVLFARALRRGRLRAFWHRLTRRDYRLRSLSQVKASAQRQPSPQAKTVHIPLARIVGSENRVRDFDATFNPLSTHNGDRWIGIAAARHRGTPLPPVDLIQVGDEYYVRDGHHRISVACALGQSEIEANILFVLA